MRVMSHSPGIRSAGTEPDTPRLAEPVSVVMPVRNEELNLADRDRMYIYYRIRSHYGYGYVFPKASHVNLGVGFKLDYYLSKLRGEHYAHHSSFIDGLVSNGLVAGRSNRVNFRAFPLPISGPLGRTYSDRILVSGDAGGFVNALTAEGIYYAMLSGDAPVCIMKGADDGSEIGAWHLTQEWQAIRNVQIRLAEYLPFALEAGIFLVPSAVEPVVRIAGYGYRAGKTGRACDEGEGIHLAGIGVGLL